MKQSKYPIQDRTRNNTMRKYIRVCKREKKSLETEGAKEIKKKSRKKTIILKKTATQAKQQHA